MKVKELIELLSKLDQEKQICIKYTDPTDWTYICSIENDNLSDWEEYTGSELGENGFEDNYEEVYTLELKEEQGISNVGL